MGRKTKGNRVNKKIRYGMVGGGPDASIGPVHRYAARMDHEYELVCGVFSRDKTKSLKTAHEIGIDSHRIYDSYEQMFAAEALLPFEQRAQVFSIVTPNHSHYPIAAAAIEKGFNVICEKPMTCTLDEAIKLQNWAIAKNILFCVNFTKAGYPMIKQMRYYNQIERFGKIHKVYIHYHASGLEFDIEHGHNKQAKWRIDPQQAGPAGTLGDIGSHAFHLAEYVTGLSITDLFANLNCLMPNRILDDDAAILLKYNNGASGLISLSQVLPGEVENLSVAIYAEKCGIKWHIHQADQLTLCWRDRPIQFVRIGPDNKHLDARILEYGRIPGGRDEGHISALANHYKEFAKALRAQENSLIEHFDYPTIADGVRNMTLIDAALSSSQKNKWINL